MPLASNSQATLWDLQIQANVENSPIISGERPIVTGIIIDHASKPVSKAAVIVKSESMVISTITSIDGKFQVELGKHERIPGNYLVSISASTENGETGMVSIQYQVKGDITTHALTNAKLSTPEAKKYLNSNPEDFSNNPIGFMLYTYYQKLYQENLEEQKILEKIIQDREQIKEIKKTEQEFREKAIEEFNPGAGVFSGQQYEEYVNSLDEEIRDVVVSHLNFTKNLYYEAQAVRNEILENGGTADEAHQAYLAKLSTSREMIENLGNEPEEILDVPSNISNSQESSIEPNKVEEDTTNSAIFVNVNGTSVIVDYKESVFVVEVNGQILQFVVEDGKLIQINSE
ncbi:MAG: carboxypeptidase-like regulatory domain-containing protein [Nitrosopumilaceae archaeon]|nr:carboxypeptidase-like regulatory domain-containing protein [Nitrosopumilaceae archaeon]